MALPSAPLGSMPSLNVPGYIPTTVVQKQPKMWQQALAQILTGVASQAAGQAVGNTMSRDYADQYGETAATGWDKLASGPKVNEKEHGRRQDHARDKEKMLAQLQGQLGMEELRAKPGAQEEIMKGERALTASDGRMRDMQDTIARSKMTRGEQNARASLQQSSDNNRILLEQIKAALEQGDPEKQARARVASAQATFSERMNNQMFPNGATTAIPGQTPVSPNVAEFARSTGRTPEANDPAMQEVIRVFRERMSQQPQSANQGPAQIPIGRTTVPDEEIMRVLLQKMSTPGVQP